MNLQQIQNQRNTAVLSSSEIARIRRSAALQQQDTGIDETTKRVQAQHDKALQMTSTWANSIVNARQARLNRLKEESMQREEELKQIDAQEKALAKEKRKQKLAEAEKIRFSQKPEIRAVHAQLLLHEVQKERERQIFIKQVRKEMQQEMEDLENEAVRSSLAAAEKKEQDLALERRKRNIEAAEELKKQVEEVRQRKLREKREENEDEKYLNNEARRLLDTEQLEHLKHQEAERRHHQEVLDANADLARFKARQKQLDKLEDERIAQQKILQDEELDRRAAETAKRRAERQAVQDKLIELQAQHLAAIKAQQKEFEDTMVEMQFSKERAQIENMRKKQEQLKEERRRDYLEAQAKLEAKRRKTKLKSTFPEKDEQEDQFSELEAKRKSALHDLAQFQLQQIKEKKEREATEKERNRLEFLYQQQLEEEKTREAQEYAMQVLQNMH